MFLMIQIWFENRYCKFELSASLYHECSFVGKLVFKSHLKDSLKKKKNIKRLLCSTLTLYCLFCCLMCSTLPVAFPSAFQWYLHMHRFASGTWRTNWRTGSSVLVWKGHPWASCWRLWVSRRRIYWRSRPFWRENSRSDWNIMDTSSLWSKTLIS